MTDDELRVIDTLRALASICDAWEKDEELGIGEMNNQLEEVVEVADGNKDFHQFLQATGLRKIEHS